MGSNLDFPRTQHPALFPAPSPSPQPPAQQSATSSSNQQPAISHTHVPSDPRITEHRNPRSASIDLATPLEIVDVMNAEDRTVADAVATQRTRIAAGIELVEHAFRSGGRLFYVGAGTSGRLGILDASECPPTFGTDPELVQGILARGHRGIQGLPSVPEPARG